MKVIVMLVQFDSSHTDSLERKDLKLLARI
jgi:hypothetical protein